MKQILYVLMSLLTVNAVSAQEVGETDSLSHDLDEVTVTAGVPTTRLESNSFITPVAGTPLAALGTCLDVLSRLPLVTVTDGGVEVTGRGEPEIFIDGRPMRDSDELRQLLSENIKKIELITAPSAMYSADTGAVVRIFTTRSFIDGLSITERVEGEKRRKWSVNGLSDLSYRTGAWEMFASVSAATNNSVIKGSTTNTFDHAGRTTVIGSSQHNSYPSHNAVLKAGFNHNTGDESFGAYYRYNPERGDFSNRGTEWLNDEPPVERLISTEINSRSHLVSMYYDRQFSGKYTLHFDGNYRHSSGRSHTETIYPDRDADDVASADSRRSTLWAAKLYMEMPLWGGTLTAGTQDSYTGTSLDYRMHNPDVAQYIPSSFSKATQTAAALFASWSRGIGPLSLSAGLRYEYVDYRFEVDGRKDRDISRRDHTAVPDISLDWSIDPRTQLSLSYRMSTIRPPYSQLTGSLTYTGRYETEGGNPALRDERSHCGVLSASRGDFIFQSVFTRALDTYAYVKRQYPAGSGRLMMNPVNIDVSALNLFVVWNRNIGVWSPNYTLGMYQQWLRLDGIRHDRPIYSYYLENMFTLPGDIIITGDIYGSTQGDMHTNRFCSQPLTMDASVSKSFFNDSLRLRLEAHDIFNTSRNDWSMDTYGVHVDKKQRYDNRGVSLTVTYRLHPRRSGYKGKDPSAEETKRL